MEYINLPRINIKASKMVYGTSNNHFLYGHDATELLDAVIESGVNVIDTARMYLKAEKVLGNYIKKRNNRKDLVIISKCAHPSALLWRPRLNEKDVRKDLAKSLKALNTNYIDIYLMHRDDPRVKVEVIVKLFNTLINEGKIKAYGCSNFSLARIIEINNYAKENNLIPMEYSSPQYSLVENVNNIWKATSSLQGDNHLLERNYYRDNKIIVLAYSSLAMGFLSGKFHYFDKDIAKKKLSSMAYKGFYSESNLEILRKASLLSEEKNCSLPQISLAYLMNQDFTVLPIVSAQSVNRIKENFEAVDIKLTKEEIKKLEH